MISHQTKIIANQSCSLEIELHTVAIIYHILWAPYKRPYGDPENALTVSCGCDE